LNRRLDRRRQMSAWDGRRSHCRRMSAWDRRRRRFGVLKMRRG
jgi:hypothetical protein